MFFYLVRHLSVWHVECNRKIVWGLTSFFSCFLPVGFSGGGATSCILKNGRPELVRHKRDFLLKKHSMERGSICGQLDDKQEVGLTWSLWHDSPRLDTSCNLHLMLCFDCFDHFQAVRFVVKLRYFIGQISTSRFEWHHWIFQQNVDRKGQFSNWLRRTLIENLVFWIPIKKIVHTLSTGLFLKGKKV